MSDDTKSSPSAARASRRMRDIARMAGVSESTVSRALSGSPLVAEGTRERILEIARASGYVVNEQARSLALGRLQVVEVIFAIERGTLQQVSDPFFVDMLATLIDGFSQHDYDVLVSHATPWDPARPGSAYVNGRAAGLVIVGQGRHRSEIRDFARSRDCVVTWGAVGEDDDYCVVGSENANGAELAIRHLLDLGRRSIAFMGDTALSEIRQRFRGYRNALAGAGIDPDPRLQLPAPFDIERARVVAQSLPSLYPAFDAIFAASDMIAMAAIATLREHGLRVPEDVSVVGFDDIPAVAHLYPGLTTVRQDIPRAGKLLVRRLLDLLQGKPAPSTAIETRLIVRETCGADRRSRTDVQGVGE